MHTLRVNCDEMAGDRPRAGLSQSAAWFQLCISEINVNLLPFSFNLASLFLSPFSSFSILAWPLPFSSHPLSTPGGLDYEGAL